MQRAQNEIEKSAVYNKSKNTQDYTQKGRTQGKRDTQDVEQAQ